MITAMDTNGAPSLTPAPEPAGVSVRNVERWFATEVPHAVPPFVFELIAGGHSNLTYRLTDAAGQQFVLRRPPLNSVLATAHDMGREWRAIHALQDTLVPVPPALGFCPDPEVSGQPFYVMGFVEGCVQHSITQTLTLTPEQRRISGETLFDVLADLHGIDVEAVGLLGHGPHTGYVERQIRRWYKQYTVSKSQDTPDLESSYVRLLERLPEHSELTIAHGDYRLGNCITSPTGPIAAVLDWEISTLGDPLADLAYLLNTWVRPGSVIATMSDAAMLPTMADGFGSAEEMLHRYAVRSGRDVSHIEYYVAFNHFKSACIVQGVLSRYLSGALGDTSNVDLDGFARAIADRSAMAIEALDSLPLT